MAVETLVMSSNAALHPFFAKPSEAPPAPLREPDDATAVCTNGNDKLSKSKVKSEKIKVNSKSQTSLGHFLKQDVLPDVNAVNASAISQNDERKKRRRTSVDGSVDVGAEQHEDVSVQRPATAIEEDVQQGTTAMNPQTPPKRMLKLNAKGKLRSPVTGELMSKNTVDAPRRGRPRKSKEPQPPRQLIAFVRYKPGEDGIGSKIDAIMRSELTIDLPKPTPKKTRTPRKTKSTHPFFVDKQKQSKAIVIASPRRMAATTPGKLRAKAANERAPMFEDAAPTWESALLKDRFMIKHPGAKEPLWPAKGMSHIREAATTPLPPSLPRRKHKQALPSAQDPLLARFSKQLEPEPEPEVRSDGFCEPRQDLRIPEKLLMSGTDITTMITNELAAPLLQGDLDELAPKSSQTTIHPALEHVYRTIPPYLSAFDKIQGEQISWTQRAAPQTADQILQPPKEMHILKAWLQAMAVNSVESKQERTEPEAKPRKKRKTRPADLEDFVVDGDDDVRGMDTVADDATPGSQSLVQSQPTGVRPNNTVLISGPHGCGKTAAVYAVAKELGFRVFEISSSERRSGKDVLDKIGNLTENHIVKRHAADSETELSGAEDNLRIDAAFKQDLESGRQGKMSAFFKPAIAAKKPASVVKAKVIDNLKTAIKRSAKEQQQSLILLEEVDILFKEDKEFWSTVLRLVQTSKRPFIMTCNDEDLVAIQALQLHAVLRLIPPPENLAVDYLLLLAAKEGHLLRRAAIRSLWRDCRHDLRRSLTTLDFWCRMGVGDIRDGLGWIYQRWPIGSDLDSKGRPLRLVSKGTYLAGMCVEASSSTDRTSINDLEAFSVAADQLSSVDCWSTVPQMDTTLPPMPQKRRSSYIEGLVLLDAPHLADFSGLHAALRDAALSYCPLALHNASAASLTRQDFAGFDALAYSDTSAGMEQSVFDGTFTNLVVDVAPFVRQVIRYEAMLAEHREAISGPAKRARKTRVARSALEGGQRQLTRREEWWEGSSSMRGVLSTAGREWSELVRTTTTSSNGDLDEEADAADVL